MLLLSTILLVAAFVLFILAGIGVPASRFNLVAFGLACGTLALLLPRVQ